MDADELFQTGDSFKRDFPRFVWAIGQLGLVDYMQIQKIQEILVDNIAEGKELELAGICYVINGLSIYYGAKTYDLGILNSLS